MASHRVRASGHGQARPSHQGTPTRNTAIDLAVHVVGHDVLAVGGGGVEFQPEAHVVADGVSDHVAPGPDLDSIAGVAASRIPGHSTAGPCEDTIAAVVAGYVVADDAVVAGAQPKGVAEGTHVLDACATAAEIHAASAKPRTVPFMTVMPSSVDKMAVPEHDSSRHVIMNPFRSTVTCGLTISITLEEVLMESGPVSRKLHRAISANISGRNGDGKAGRAHPG